MQTYTLKDYNKEHLIYLKEGRYLEDNSLAVQMIEITDGESEPYATLTVRLDQTDLLPPNCAFLNTNGFSDDTDILQWVQDNNIATPIGIMATSGFCTYPAVEFNKGIFTL